MKENAVLLEIRATRDELSCETDHDVHALFEKLKRETQRFAAQGWTIVSSPPTSPIPCVVRETPSDS
jgi:hypothetical protein